MASASCTRADSNSIPSDLGVLILHEAVKADGAGDLEDTTFVVSALKGGLSGGTIDSMRVQVKEVRADPQIRRLVADPYALSPDRAEEPTLGDERDLMTLRHDSTLGMWVGPFLLAGANTRVVRRSNALLGWAYGRRFRYREVTGYGSGAMAPVRGAAMASAVVGLGAGMSFAPSRALLGRVLPSPGEGPSAKSREAGFFRIAIHARTSSGARYVARVAAKGDPGYAATSMMLGEAAMSLARDDLARAGRSADACDRDGHAAREPAAHGGDEAGRRAGYCVANSRRQVRRPRGLPFVHIGFPTIGRITARDDSTNTFV